MHNGGCKVQTKIFITIGCLLLSGLLGASVYFSGRNSAQLAHVQSQLILMQTHIEASEKAIGRLGAIKEAVANARGETDKAMEAGAGLSGDVLYEFYDRLLYEDACRRAGGSPASSRTDGPVH